MTVIFGLQAAVPARLGVVMFLSCQLFGLKPTINFRRHIQLWTRLSRTTTPLVGRDSARKRYLANVNCLITR